jgi:zinc transporter ZupT
MSAAGHDPGFGWAFVTGIAAHKLPEGLALGLIARAALPNRVSALAWCALAQSAMLIGGGLELILAPFVGQYALHVLLALAGGSFVYLGFHAIHGELRRSGTAPTIVPALTGMAGSSVLRMFVR